MFLCRRIWWISSSVDCFDRRWIAFSFHLFLIVFIQLWLDSAVLFGRSVFFMPLGFYSPEILYLRRVYMLIFSCWFFFCRAFALELQILLRMELFDFNWSKDVSFVIIYAFMLLWSFVSWSIWKLWTLFNLFGPCIYCLLVQSCMAIGNGRLRYLSTCSYVICFWLTQASDLNSSSVFSDVFHVWFWASVYAFIRCYSNGNRIFLELLNHFFSCPFFLIYTT